MVGWWFAGRGLYSGIVWVACMVVVCSSGSVLLLRDCVMCWFLGCGVLWYRAGAVWCDVV